MLNGSFVKFKGKTYKVVDVNNDIECVSLLDEATGREITACIEALEENIDNGSVM